MIHYIQRYLFNMWRHSILIIMLSFLSGQSIHNAYGLGLISFDHNAASAGISSRGIVPSFYRGISLSNPVTWNQLKYAFLSGNYNGDEANSELGTNGNSGIISAQFTVPMGEQYAWGFGIKPIFNQQYMVTDEPYDQYIEDDTLSTQKSVDGSGGINSLYTAFNFPISKKEHMAVEWSVLFGSLRKDIILDIDQSFYHYFQRQMYSGSLYKIYLSTERLHSEQFPLNMYLMFSGSFNPLKVKKYTFQPFEDTNFNNYYDAADKPSPSDIPNAEITVFNNVYEPSEIGFGIDYQYKSNTYFLFEAHRWSDNAQKESDLFPLRSLYITQSEQLSFSSIRFAQEDAFRFTQMVQYRGGLYYRKDKLYNDQNTVNELGISLGIGVKFGAANNQLDIAYRYGIRSGETISDETIQQFTVGIQLGDRWFVKRRPK